MGAVQDHAGADFEKRSEIANGVVGRAGDKEGGQRRQKALPAKKQESAGDPADHDQRRRDIHPEHQRAIQLGFPIQEIGAQQLPQIAMEAFGVADGPALDLAAAGGPGDHDFFITLGAVHVGDFPAVDGELQGQVGVLGERKRIPAADGFERRPAHAAHGAAELRDQTQVVAGLLVDLIASGALQVEQPGQQRSPHVVRHDASHHGAHFGVGKGRRQELEQRLARDIVGVKDDQDVALGNLRRSLQSRRFAAQSFGAVERLDEGILLGIFVQNVPGAVVGMVVDRNDLEQFRVVRIVGFEQRLDDIGRHRLLVVHRDQHRDRRQMEAGQVGIVHPLVAEQSRHREDEMPHHIAQHHQHHKHSQDFRHPHHDCHTSFCLTRYVAARSIASE